MKKKRVLQLLALLIVLPLFFLGLAVTFFSLSYADRIYPGIKVDGLNLGGKTVRQAARAVAFSGHEDKELTLRWLDKSKKVRLKNLGVTVNAQATAKQAYLVGRQGSFLNQLSQRLKFMVNNEYIVKPVFSFHNKRAQKTLAELAVLINQPAADAQLILNPQQVKIIPSQNEQKLLIKENLSLFKKAFNKKTIRLKLHIKPPKTTTEDLQKLKVETLMSEFATIIPPGTYNRFNNIKLAAAKLNDWRIKPGEVFSFNAAVGPRTTKAGYLPAPVIEAGNLTTGIGGGICQVSTTLYNAAMLAGLPIKERYLHSNYISTYPPGRDATVVYNALDLKFKNDTNGTIIIKSSVSNSRLIFWLYGPKTNRKVEFSQPEIFNIVPFSVKEVVDPALPPGVKLKEQSGVPGRSVKVIRTVKQDGKLLFSEEILSRYTPRQEIIKLGPTPETTAPTVTTETVPQ